MSLSRRDVLRSTGLVIAGAALGACGTAAPAGPVADTSARTPQRGGTLRAVFTGGGAQESLDPFAGGSPADYGRNNVIYDSLFSLRDGEVVPALAQSAQAAADGRSFVLKLREGVRWHDGSAFTANDVAYSFRYMSSPDRPYPSELSSYFDFAGTVIENPVTLRIPTAQPVGDPAVLLAAFPAKMVKDKATTFTAGQAIGTGPYRVDAFEAGRETRLRRFDEHWDGAPYADSLVLLSLTDPQAKVNAVLTGQADFAADIPFTTARTGTNDPEIQIRTAGERNRVGFGFVLNSTIAPFNDPRARRAVRLGIDRQALVNTVLLGYGTAGNDLFGAGSKYFSTREPLQRNVDEARKLLKDAGAEGATVTIRSAEWEIGYNASTQLFAEQMREIGLTVRPEIVGVSEFFDVNALNRANGLVFSIGGLPLPVVYGRLAAYPALGFADPQLKTAMGAALASTDENKRQQAWHEVQDVMFDRGNTVIWGLADTLSVARRNVAGVEVRDVAKYPYLGKAGLA